MSANRLGALTGVGFVVFLILSFVVGGEPPAQDDSTQEIVDFYTDNEDQVWFGIALGMIAAALLVFFGGYLRKVLRAAEGEGHMLSTVVLAGATIVAVGGAFDATLSVALVETVDDIDPTALQAINAIWNNDYIPIALGAMIISLAAGISIVRHGALPKWLGWVAIAFGVISVTPIGFAGVIGTALWILVVSIMLALRADETSTA
jgi:Domain of unknown function (DUF4386)